MKLYSTHLLGLCDEHHAQQTVVYIVIVVHCLNSQCMLHNERQWRVKNLRRNKNLLDYLFHSLTTVRFHYPIILYHLFQSSLKMPGVKKLPLGYYSQLDRSQYEEKFPDTKHSCFPLKCHRITPGAPTLNQYFFSFRYLSPSSFSNPLLLFPFNNSLICSSFNLQHKSTLHYLCLFP